MNDLDNSLISIILCTYNKKEFIKVALNSLVNQKINNEYKIEIIVVDDGSIDGTKKEIEKYVNKTNIVIKKYYLSGGGISYARNYGIKMAEGNWIAFFDQDQIADEKWIYELYSFAINNNKCIVDGSRQLLVSKEKYVRLGNIQKRALGEIKEKKHSYMHKKNTCSCTGNVIIKKTVFDYIKGFDEKMLQGGEDWEFFCKASSLGIEIWNNPKAKVKHIIPEERLKNEYFKSSCYRHGNNFAQRDYNKYGKAGIVILSIARIIQSIIIHIPVIIISALSYNTTEYADRKCLLRRNIGFIKKTLNILMPNIFAQKLFNKNIMLRK